jgi:ADP-heptose:LPS heptosyltransferase
MQNSFNRIVIFRALKLGDMLCSIPAFRALRGAFPDSSISLITHKSMGPLIKRYSHYIDEFIPFSGFPGLPEQEYKDEDIADFISALKERQFDLAIQMHGSGETSNQFVELIEAKMMLAFHRNGQPYPGEGIFLPYPENGHEIHRCLKLLEGVQVYATDTSIDFPIHESDYLSLATILSQKHLDLNLHHYICIHPGASTKDKRWSLENFVKLANHLIELGHQIVFTGYGQETELIEEIMDRMISGAINTAGLNLDLGCLGVLLKNSSTLICNDTGISHLAAALDVKSMVIFTNSNLQRWAPLNHHRHVSLFTPSVEAVLSCLERKEMV